MSEEDLFIRAKTELYFGFAMPNGGQVSPFEWDTFVAENIIPVFPGLTCIDANGVWYSKHGAVVKETSRLVILIHPDTPDCYKLIEVIRNEYKRLFYQESVLRVTTLVNADF
jgi:hypothetical protein